MIRPAKQTDARALGVVYCQGWQKGYAGLMPQFFLDALTPPALVLVCFVPHSQRRGDGYSGIPASEFVFRRL